MSPLPLVVVHNDDANSTTPQATTDAAVSATSSFVVEHNPYALALALIPLLTIFGNGLVILAVCRERALRTVTNLLIVSLAVSDMLVALCVMFFAVYFEWNSFIWDLGPTLCNLYIGADVACSTASILNLLAISIDRYIAISHPLAYCQIGTNQRAYVSIALVWGVSISVAIPLAFGANHIESEHECAFTNPLFMIGSSLLSFFLPCLAMIAVYAVVFRRLRERERARTARKRCAMMSGVESALIANALMGGAKMARQIAKSHLKDQLLLELSLQTSSFPTGSPSEEEEEEEEEEDEEEEDPFESEGDSAHMRRRRRQRRIVQHLNNVERRPTFCLMMNGGMPFPMAPMNPLQLPMTTLRNEAERRVKGWRRKRTLRILRRCNTLPCAVIHQRYALRASVAAGATDVFPEAELLPEEHSEDNRLDKSSSPEVDPSPTAALQLEPDSGFPLPERTQSAMLAEDAVADAEADGSADDLLRMACSASASEYSLQHELHEETRSFGDELEERFPFIDRSLSVASSLASALAAVRKWSQVSGTGSLAAPEIAKYGGGRTPSRQNSCEGGVAVPRDSFAYAFTDSLPDAADRKASLQLPRMSLGTPQIRLASPVTSPAHLCAFAYSGDPFGAAGSVSSGCLSGLPDGNNNNANNNNRLSLLDCRRLSTTHSASGGVAVNGSGTLCATTTNMLLHQLSSNLSLPNLISAASSPSRMDLNNNSQTGGTEIMHPAVPLPHNHRDEFADDARRKSSFLMLRNGVGANKRKSGGASSAKQRGGGSAGGPLAWLIRLAASVKRPKWKGDRKRGEVRELPESLKLVGVIESAHRPSSSLPSATTVLADARSTSGSVFRSVRISRPSPLPQPPPTQRFPERKASCSIAPSVVPERNGGAAWVKRASRPEVSIDGIAQKKISTASSAFSSSPLRYIRQAFRRSLVPILEEGRRPSRALLKRATRQMRREQKATVTLAIVLAVFLCCWVPFFALHLSNAICLLTGGVQCVHLLAMFLSTWLGYLNSSLNPLIYTVFDKRFRKAFRNLLGCTPKPGSTRLRHHPSGHAPRRTSGQTAARIAPQPLVRTGTIAHRRQTTR